MIISDQNNRWGSGSIYSSLEDMPSMPKALCSDSPQCRREREKEGRKMWERKRIIGGLSGAWSPHRPLTVIIAPEM